MNFEKTDKYLYIKKTPTWLVRGIYIFGICTWIGVIYGYSRFLVINPMFLAVIAPVIIFLIFYHLVSYIITLCYVQFDLPAHKLLLNKTLSLNAPSVDIFLPICGEKTEVIARTFLAVSQLNYVNKKIYVLDDKGVDDHKHLADVYNFIYLSREDKGRMKKAGNLKHGFERSTGDFIVVFDADFAPLPEFIQELLPYMEDPRVAIVQSPQYFQTDKELHNRSPLEYGASHIQEDFYRVIQVARDRLGAPICCGSNALYRRTALDQIGGTFQIEHSEDMHTGFELTNKGWRVKYVPIILATGFCPDGLHSFFHQQHRWCSGSLSLMLDKKFWRSNLSFPQKMCFISGFMYYLSHPITILLSFQVFFLLFFYKDSISILNALPFLPCILFSFLIIPLFRITRQRYGGFLARNACMYSYTHAIVTAFIKKSVGWQPTNIKSSSVSKAYMQQMIFTAVYFFIYIIFIAFSISRGVFQIFNVRYYSLLFWIFYNTIATSVTLSQLYLVLDETKQKQLVDNKEISASLTSWRLKTAGVYTSLTVGIFFGIAYFPTIQYAYGSIVLHKQITLVSSDQFISPATLSGIATSTTRMSPPYVSFTKDYFVGDSAENILVLQTYLNKKGFLLREEGPGSPGKETQYFGPYTHDALRRFQAANNIHVTGYLDRETRTLISVLDPQ